MRAIPVELRRRILRLYGRGQTTREIADLLDYSEAAVRRVRQQFKERGSLEPQTDRCGRKPLLTEARRARLLKLLAERPDATLAELGAGMDRKFGTSTVDLWLRRLGWGYKKNAARVRTGPAGRGGPAGRLA